MWSESIKAILALNTRKRGNGFINTEMFLELSKLIVTIKWTLFHTKGTLMNQKEKKNGHHCTTHERYVQYRRRFYYIFYIFLLATNVTSWLGCKKLYWISIFYLNWTLIFKAEEFKWIQMK